MVRDATVPKRPLFSRAFLPSAPRWYLGCPDESLTATGGAVLMSSQSSLMSPARPPCQRSLVDCWTAHRRHACVHGFLIVTVNPSVKLLRVGERDALTEEMTAQ